MADGAITLPDGVPTQVTVERPAAEGSRRLRHQRRAPAGQEGRAPTRAPSPTCVAERLAPADGVAEVEVAGPGFLNITVEAGAQGQVAADIVAAGAALRHLRRVRRREDQPRVRLGQPDRSAAPRRRRAGPRSATRSAGCFEAAGAEVTREYYFNDHGAQIDRFAASLLAQRPGRAGPRGRLRRRVHRRHRRGRRRASTPTCSDLRRRAGAGGLPRASASTLMFAEIKQSLHDFGVDFDVYFHENDLHDGGAVERAIDAADRAGPHLRGRRRALAAHRAVRRRQGPGASSGPTASRPTSPATSPTTSTSASAASTAASSCSAPTTTATSAG